MSDCIEWTGSRNQYGYGRYMTAKYRNQPAHRVAWREAHGRIPPGMIIMHTCDNPPCVNLDHLRLGTHADNVADCWAKGRRNAGRKLTAEKAATIRSSLAAGESSQALANRYGVHIKTIQKIGRGAIWQRATENQQ